MEGIVLIVIMLSMIICDIDGDIYNGINDDYDAIYNYANEEDENEDIEDCLDNVMK
jgi:hypothetical protein